MRNDSRFVKRDSWASAHIAGIANGLDIQRLVVIPMVVTFGLIAAIAADLSLRMRQEPISDSHPHDSIDAIDPIYSDSARTRPPNGVSSSPGNASFAVASPQISITDDLTALRAWLGVMDFEHLEPHPVLFRLAVGPATVGCKLGPNIRPVTPQVLALYFALRLPFDADTKLAPELLPSASSLSHVALRRSAARREICALGLVEAVEVGDKLVHTHILPDGNRKSIPFGDLPLGNGQ